MPMSAKNTALDEGNLTSKPNPRRSFRRVFQLCLSIIPPKRPGGPHSYVHKMSLRRFACPHAVIKIG